MKKRLKITILAFSSIGILALASCKKTLDSMANFNVNQNQPTSASSPTLLTAAEYSGVMKDEGGFGDGFLGIFDQHSAGNHATGVLYNVYTLKHTDLSFLFQDAYVSSLMNLQQLINNALPTDQSYVGIAQILQAYQLGYVTSMYGDIPWSEALNVSKYPSPKYDAQTDVYAAVQNLLSAGINNLKAGGDIGDGTQGNSGGDLIYNGLSSNWIAAGYLLKARFYNHFSKADPTGSATNALLMVDSAQLSGLTSDAGDFVLPYDGTTATTTNPWLGMYQNGMVVASVPFLNSLISNNDPRINAYYDSLPSPTFGTSSVYGLAKVIDGNTGTGLYMLIGTNSNTAFGQPNSPLYMATYPELKMIEAEAAFRAGDLARAAAAHNAGIIANLNFIVSAPSDIAKIPAYVSNFASETAATITLGKIMTEKFKLMFTIEGESWMDVRRYNYAYPTWLSIPVVDATVTPTVPVATSFIQRLLYPQSELNTNAANVPTTTIYDKLPILQ